MKYFHDIKKLHLEKSKEEQLNNPSFKLKYWILNPNTEANIERYKHIVDDICFNWWWPDTFKKSIKDVYILQEEDLIRQWFDLDVFDELQQICLLHDKLYWEIFTDVKPYLERSDLEKPIDFFENPSPYWEVITDINPYWIRTELVKPLGFYEIEKSLLNPKLKEFQPLLDFYQANTPNSLPWDVSLNIDNTDNLNQDKQKKSQLKPLDFKLYEIKSDDDNNSNVNSKKKLEIEKISNSSSKINNKLSKTLEFMDN